MRLRHPLDLRVIMPEPARVIPVLGGGIIKKLMTAFKAATRCCDRLNDKLQNLPSC